MYGICESCGNAMLQVAGESCPTCGARPLPRRQSLPVDLPAPTGNSIPTARLVDPIELVEMARKSVYATARKSLSAEALRHSETDGAKKFLAVAGILFAIAGFWAFQNWQFLRTAIPVMGVVSSSHDVRTRKGYTRTSNTVEYSVGGKSQNYFTYDLSTGDRVDLLVSPTDPTYACESTFNSLWLWPTIIAGFGSLIGLVGVIFLVPSRPGGWF